MKLLTVTQREWAIQIHTLVFKTKIQRGRVAKQVSCHLGHPHPSRRAWFGCQPLFLF